jgi:MoxR-like ATPase
MKIPDLKEFIDIKHCLEEVGTWRKSVHVFDERTAQAIRAALASGRPLLVRGEPGTGKSQLARAAAKVLGRKFLSHVVDAHTEIQDLWYRFDAVSRLGHAQILSVRGKTDDASVEELLNPEKYLSPGILWWAFSWTTACSQACQYPLYVPDANDAGNEQNGVVLLLDEIDKADADLPNSLLETLDNSRFTVPWIKKTVGVAPDGQDKRPLVVLTTNEDRQLPGAFVRRCMVLELYVPEEKNALSRYLKERAAFHFPSEEKNGETCNTFIERNENGTPIISSRFHDDILSEAAEQLYKDRLEANKIGVTPPGQAEYLDMLRVLDELAQGDTPRQQTLLRTIKEFALKKYRGMQKPVSSVGSTESNADWQENEAGR